MLKGARRPRWEDLSGDLLVSVFEKLAVDDLIAGVSFCCAAWRAAATDPSCWRRLDFRRWDVISRRLPAADFRDLLRFSIVRAGGASEVILFPHFAGEDDLLFAAERCPRLRYFSLTSEEDPTEQFLLAIEKLQNLQGMAINGAAMCEEVLEALSRRRRRPGGARLTELEVCAERMSERTAAAICDALPHLRKLTLRDCNMPQAVVLLFLERLERLESFDISGYSAPRILENVLRKAARLKEFLWESEFDLDDLYRCSGSCGDIFSRNPPRR